jgi:hypothetical protein
MAPAALPTGLGPQRGLGSGAGPLSRTGAANTGLGTVRDLFARKAATAANTSVGGGTAPRPNTAAVGHTSVDGGAAPRPDTAAVAHTSVGGGTAPRPDTAAAASRGGGASTSG